MKHGSDPELASISIGFPLDSVPTKDSFPGALKVFHHIAQCDTSCGITFVGWSSPGGSIVGEQVWDGQLSTSAAYEKCPELKEFSNLDGVSHFSFSALFEIIEQDQDSLLAHGSPVMTQRLHFATGLPWEKGTQGSPLRRVPTVVLEGNKAVSAGLLAVKDYSNYVAALFENFD